MLPVLLRPSPHLLPPLPVSPAVLLYACRERRAFAPAVPAEHHHETAAMVFRVALVALFVPRFHITTCTPTRAQDIDYCLVARQIGVKDCY